MHRATRQVIVVQDAEALADVAASRLVARLAAGGARPAVCLTGGSSPRRLYELLGADEYKQRIPWDRTHWFVGDDRFVPPDDVLSNMGIARRLFLDGNAPPENIHAIPTFCADPELAALDYERALRVFYGGDRLSENHPLFDLVLMGVGPDGHTASLFPGSPALEERQRWVVGVDEANVAPFVPRVTLTIPALESCREMLFLVEGENKREIVSRVMADEDLPAAKVSPQGETVWLMDAAAAGRSNA